MRRAEKGKHGLTQQLLHRTWILVGMITILGYSASTSAISLQASGIVQGKDLQGVRWAAGFWLAIKLTRGEPSILSDSSPSYLACPPPSSSHQLSTATSTLRYTMTRTRLPRTPTQVAECPD